MQSIQPQNKTSRPLKHVGSTQPVDTDSVPTHHTVEKKGWVCDEFSFQNAAKEDTGRLAGLIRLYKTTHA